jgi:XapX domain-containing protein
MLSAILSLLAGLVAGIGYGLCGIRSPAPPAIALLGLLGMLAGERGVLLAWRLVGSQLCQTPRAETPAQRSDDCAFKTPERETTKGYALGAASLNARRGSPLQPQVSTGWKCRYRPALSARRCSGRG